MSWIPLNPREQHETVTGEVQVEYQEKILHQRVVGMEQAPRGSGHGPKLLEFKKHLDNALRHMV